MKRVYSRIIGVIMLLVAIVFIMFALNHPEKSFPWSNAGSFPVTLALLMAPKMKKSEIPVRRIVDYQKEGEGMDQKKTSSACPRQKAIVYLIISAVVIILILTI